MPPALADAMEQLEAAARLLRRMPEGPAKEKVSAAQSKAVCKRMEPITKPEDLSKLMLQIQEAEGSFLVGDQERLVTFLSDKFIEAEAQEEGRQFWDFRNLLPASVLGNLPAEDGHVTLQDFLFNGGLWTPTEATFQLMSVFLLIATGQENLSPKAKNLHLKFVKQRWNKTKLGRRPPAAYIRTLPDTAEQLQRQHPALYNDLYQYEPPQPHHFSDQAIEVVSMGAWMRVHKKPDEPAAAQSSIPAAMPPSSASTWSTQGMPAMGSTQGMPAMAAQGCDPLQQQYMVQMQNMQHMMSHMMQMFQAMQSLVPNATLSHATPSQPALPPLPPTLALPPPPGPKQATSSVAEPTVPSAAPGLPIADSRPSRSQSNDIFQAPGANIAGCMQTEDASPRGAYLRPSIDVNASLRPSSSPRFRRCSTISDELHSVKVPERSMQGGAIAPLTWEEPRASNPLPADARNTATTDEMATMVVSAIQKRNDARKERSKEKATICFKGSEGAEVSDSSFHIGPLRTGWSDPPYLRISYSSIP